MMTEFRIYELTRTEGKLYGQFFATDSEFPQRGEYQLHVPRVNGPSWDGMRLCLHRPPDYEELFVMATGWLPWLVNLRAMDGFVFSRSYLPISVFTLHPTDVETGFARFTTAAIPDSPLMTYMVTARRSG